MDNNYLSPSFFDEYPPCWDTIPNLDLDDLLLSNNYQKPDTTNSLDFNADDLINFLSDDPQFPNPPSPTISDSRFSDSGLSSGSSTKDFVDNNSQNSGFTVKTEPPPAKKPKTIVLPQKDFKALMERIKNGTSDLKTELGCRKVTVKRTYNGSQNGTVPLPKIAPASGEVAKPPSPILTRPPAPKPPMVIDERLLKRQQRMMKNRESASISRKRKKDYLSSLEKENMELKQENSCLRSQLLNFAQICKCKHVQISDFVTNKFNAKTASSSSGKKNLFFSSASKKNTAVLLAMVFMVSLNFGPFSLPSFNEDDGAQLASPDTYTGRRNLLWFASENDDNDNEIAEGPMNANDFEKYEKGQPSKCGTKSNQTENMRLAMELQKWIKKNNVHNISSIDESLEVLKLSMNFLETTNFRKMFKKSLRNRRFFGRHRNLFDNGSTSSSEKSNYSQEVDMNVYKPKSNDEYSKLFEGIGRRDDTFYVLTFNADNIYLPASAYNKSNRPKMSLMVPTKDFSSGIEQVTLLQIDCEVLNTTQVHLNADAIPTDLKHKVVFNENKTTDGIPRTKYSNASAANSKVPLYRPYFIDKFNTKVKNPNLN